MHDPRRKRFQFGLATLFWMMAVAGVVLWMGWEPFARLISALAPVDKQTEAVFVALERPMDLEVDELPLLDTMAHIGSSQGINIQFEYQALESTNAPTAPVAYSGNGKPVRQVIEEILKPYGLTYAVDNGILTIVKSKR